MKKIIVVGAGIAGMTAGIYLKRAGFDVTLLEQHTIPGGMCTSWKRKGYLFEGAVHWLTGSNPKNSLYRLWRDTDALNESVYVKYPEVFTSLEHDGKVYYLYRDISRTCRELEKISPADKKLLNELERDVRAIEKIQMPVTDIKGVKAETPSKMNGGDMLKMASALPRLGKLSGMTVKEYTDRFTDAGIRKVLTCVPEEYGAMSMIFTLATFSSGDGGYPEGGSLGMTKRMADKFTSLGGELRLGTRVKRVIVENSRAVGVELDGEELRADAVVVAAETIAALDKLFDTPPNDKWLREMKETTKPSVCTFICLGVRTRLPQIPNFSLEKPIEIGGISYNSVGFNHYSDKDGFAPEGGTALTAFFGGDSYEYWLKAKNDGRYDEEKRRVGEALCEILISRYPEAEGKIEVCDVATPLTYERYTSAYHGSWMSVMGKNETQKTAPAFSEDIGGLFFAGHRMTSPGGLPVALSSGRTAAQLVCKEFGAVFK